MSKLVSEVLLMMKNTTPSWQVTMNVKETITGTERHQWVPGRKLVIKLRGAGNWWAVMIADQGWITVIIGRCGPQQLVSQKERRDSEAKNVTWRNIRSTSNSFFVIWGSTLLIMKSWQERMLTRWHTDKITVNMWHFWGLGLHHWGINCRQNVDSQEKIFWVSQTEKFSARVQHRRLIQSLHSISFQTFIFSVRGLLFPPKVRNNFNLQVLETRQNEFETFLQSIVRLIHPENNVDMSNFLNFDVKIGTQTQELCLQSKQEQSEKNEASEELRIKMSSLERENVLLRSQKKVMAQLLYKHL